jgi:MYXO-CTERM domain-containing protein
MKHDRVALSALFGVGLIALARPSAADDWLISRHDRGRTGASTGAVPTVQPVVKWRAYIGGRHIDATVRFGLADPSVAVAAVGGRLVAKDVVTQATIWRSEMVGDGRIIDIADLDGDGRDEVVFTTSDRAYILNASTGATQWASPTDLFRTIAAVRVVDVDGDGLKDVYIDECAGCAKAGLAYAAAYSCASGAASPTELWVLPVAGTPPLVNSGTDGILDLDQDGIAEISLPSYDNILLLRGDDGTPIATLTPPNVAGQPFSHANALGAELDAAHPGLELLVVQTSGHVSTQSGPPGFTAFSVDPNTGRWSHRWTATAGSYDADIVHLADVVADVDGDGTSEVVLSFRPNATSTSWTTRLLDGATGALIDQLAGARFEGAADLDGVAGVELIVATPSGLSAYRLQGGRLQQAAAPLAGVRAASLVDPSLRQRGGVQRRLAVLSRAGSAAELFAGHPSDAGDFDKLPSITGFRDIQSIKLTPSGWSVGVTYQPLAGEIGELVRSDFATRPYEQIAVATTLGTLDVLSAQMQVTNGLLWLGSGAAGTILGGARQPSTGVYGGPLVATDANGPLVVLPDSTLGTYVGDATFASWLIPPIPRWYQSGLSHVSIIDLGGSLGPAVVGVEGTDLVARRSTDGALLGALDLGPGAAGGTPLPLAVAGRTPLVGLDWHTEGVQIVQHTVDFASSSIVWSGAPLPFSGFFGSGVGDLNGDGTDEWYSMNGPLNRRVAPSGQTTSFPGLSTGYSIPMVAPLARGAAPSLLLQGGTSSLKMATSALALGWDRPVTEAINGMAGALVTCGGRARFVSPAVQSPTLRAVDGLTGALTQERVLAGGGAYASIAAAVAAGASPGALSNASAVADLGGTGPAVLVGSSDGFLYAIDACTLDLRWATFMGSPVAEPVIGDVDGDGGDEIVVGISSGYIVGLDDVPFPPPPAIQVAGESADGVAIADPTRPITLTWSPVEGATAYEVALVSPEEWPLWDPPYRPATGTSMQIDLTGALAERPYRLVVRAVSAEGAGADGMSPRFHIIDTRPPTLVDVTPTFIEGGADIHIESTDDIALDYAALDWRENGDEARFSGVDTMLSGKSAAATLRWAPPVEMWGKAVVLNVSVVDSAGNSQAKALSLRVGENGAISFGDEPEDPGATDNSGCACRTGGAPSGGATPAGVLAGAAAALFALRRRQARRRSA